MFNSQSVSWFCFVVGAPLFLVGLLSALSRLVNPGNKSYWKNYGPFLAIIFGIFFLAAVPFLVEKDTKTNTAPPELNSASKALIKLMNHEPVPLNEAWWINDPVWSVGTKEVAKVRAEEIAKKFGLKTEEAVKAVVDWDRQIITLMPAEKPKAEAEKP